MRLKMKEIVLLASGSGSNVENIANYFKDSSEIKVSCVLTNKADAFVIERCQRLGLPVLYFNRGAFSKSNVVLKTLKSIDPDLIVLAGFLWKIPETIIDAFPKKIINIHPALLPKYGGKGMYGINVHNAVKENNEHETGITIHFVNKNYDEGATIFQEKVKVLPSDTPEAIAQNVHQLEYEYFPKVIEKVLNNG